MGRKVFIYQDEKYKESHGEIMVYFDNPYPGGIYIGHFKSIQDAEKEIIEWKDKAKQGIPKCGALIHWEIDHGKYDLDGFTLLNEYNIY